MSIKINVKKNGKIPTYSYKITGVPYFIAGLVLAWFLDYQLSDPMAWVVIFLWPVALMVHLVRVCFFPMMYIGTVLILAYWCTAGWENFMARRRRDKARKSVAGKAEYDVDPVTGKVKRVHFSDLQ
jgi:hypothetical protein